MWWLVLVLSGCKSPDPTGEDSAEPVDWPDVATVASGWLRGDLHYHTNYSEDAAEQGGDSVRAALQIADAWRGEAWLDAHPEQQADHLHFVAVTDHRTTDHHADPDFGHDYLVVIGGEEFGSNGHAGIWGHSEHVPHDPVGDEAPTERMQDAIDEAHAQGGLFSPNHPTYSGDIWGWEASGFDAIEVWNSGWSVLAADLTEEQLDDWVADQGGVENAAIRAASRHRGSGSNAQALRFWQAWLSLGVHVPPVGGSDRHMVFPAGLPTTYVLADSRDAAGVLGGIGDGHTFISRSPAGPQVVLRATVDGVSHPMGSALPGATSVEVAYDVSRAAGGTLVLVHGVVDASLPEPESTEIALDSDSVAGTWTWEPPAGGGWLHAVVLEPLPTDIPEGREEVYEALTTFPVDDDITDLLIAVGPLIDIDVLGTPSRCDPTSWEDWQLQCMPADTEPLATFYVPDEAQLLMNATFQDEAATGFAMGALSSAFHTAPTTR